MSNLYQTKEIKGLIQKAKRLKDQRDELAEFVRAHDLARLDHRHSCSICDPILAVLDEIDAEKAENPEVARRKTIGLNAEFPVCKFCDKHLPSYPEATPNRWWYEFFCDEKCVEKFRHWLKTQKE